MNKGEEQPSWPLVVRTEKDDKAPRLNLTKLPPEQKRRVWALLQQEAPGIADAVQVVGEFARHFDGTVTVAQADLPPSVLAITGKTQ